MLAALVNGMAVSDPRNALSIEERGLAYGDGLFETMLLRNGSVRFKDEHLQRLRTGCERLRFEPPSTEWILSDFERLAQTSRDGILKLIVTRGAGGRGYRADTGIAATRIALLYGAAEPTVGEIAVRWCETRLARNAYLAGIKHLNRLEQVLAQNEWHDASIAEGLMMDTEGEVVCATSNNLFIVTNGALSTPDLRYSGVCGVMRQQVLWLARLLGIDASESSLWPDDVLSADEVFVTNAVRGIRSVVSLGDQRWRRGPVTARLVEAMEQKA